MSKAFFRTAELFVIFICFSLLDCNCVWGEERFKIGVILPLSGPVAEYGQAMQNGIELAREESSAQFDRIEFFYEDVQYSSSNAIRAFHKLRNADRVDLLYVFGVPLSQSVAPLSERYKVPLMAQSVDQNVARNRRYVMRFSSSSRQYAESLTSYLAEQGLEKIAVAVLDNAYIEEMLQAVKAALQPNQTLTVLDSFPPAALDFRSTISRLKNSRYDAVGVFLGTGQISQFYRQLADQRVGIVSFGTNWFESKSEIISSGFSMSGAFFANNAVIPDFYQRYAKRFGNDSQITFAGYAYEFASLAAELFGHASTGFSPEEIVSKLNAAGIHQGTAMGRYVYRKDPRAGGFFDFPIHIKRICGKTIELVD